MKPTIYSYRTTIRQNNAQTVLDCGPARAYILFPFIILMLTLSGCGPRDTALHDVLAAGVLRVGLDPSWPPFEFLAPDTQQVAGLDVDLAHALAAELGVEVHFVISGWEGLYAALQDEQFDVILSAMPYDPWRTQEVVYAGPYFNAGPVIVVPASDDIRGIKDLNGYTVYVEFGSEGDVQAHRAQKQAPNLTVVPHETAQAALEALRQDSEQKTATIVDAISARGFVREQGSDAYRIAGEPLHDEAYMIAVRIEDESLHKAIEQALEALRKSGELDRLLAQWL